MTPSPRSLSTLSLAACKRGVRRTTCAAQLEPIISCAIAQQAQFGCLHWQDQRLSCVSWRHHSTAGPLLPIRHTTPPRQQQLAAHREDWAGGGAVQFPTHKISPPCIVLNQSGSRRTMKTGPVVGPSYGDWLFLKYRPAARTGPWGPTSFSRAPVGHTTQRCQDIQAQGQPSSGKCNHSLQPVCRCSSNATITITAPLGPHLSPPPPCEGTRRPACWAGGCRTCRGAAQASVKCMALTRPSAAPDREVVAWAAEMAAVCKLRSDSGQAVPTTRIC